MESGANTFPPFQSYFRLSPSACFPRSGLVYFLCVCVCPSARTKSIRMRLFLGAAIHSQRVKQTIQPPVNIPWLAWRKKSAGVLFPTNTCLLGPLLLASCNIHDNRVGPFRGSSQPFCGATFRPERASFVCV